MQNVSKLEVEKRRFHLTLSCTDIFFWKLYKGKDKVKKNIVDGNKENWNHLGNSRLLKCWQILISS